MNKKIVLLLAVCSMGKVFCSSNCNFHTQAGSKSPDNTSNRTESKLRTHTFAEAKKQDQLRSPIDSSQSGNLAVSANSRTTTPPNTPLNSNEITPDRRPSGGTPNAPKKHSRPPSIDGTGNNSPATANLQDKVHFVETNNYSSASSPGMQPGTPGFSATPPHENVTHLPSPEPLQRKKRVPTPGITLHNNANNSSPDDDLISGNLVTFSDSGSNPSTSPKEDKKKNSSSDNDFGNPNLVTFSDSDSNPSTSPRENNEPSSSHGSGSMRSPFVDGLEFVQNHRKEIVALVGSATVAAAFVANYKTIHRNNTPRSFYEYIKEQLSKIILNPRESFKDPKLRKLTIAFWATVIGEAALIGCDCIPASEKK